MPSLFPPEGLSMQAKQSGEFFARVKQALMNELKKGKLGVGDQLDVFRDKFDKQDGSYLATLYPGFKNLPLSAFDYDTTLSIKELATVSFAPKLGTKLSSTVFDPYKMVSIAILQEAYAKHKHNQGAKKWFRDMFGGATALFDLIDNDVSTDQFAGLIDTLSLDGLHYTPSSIVLTLRNNTKQVQKQPNQGPGVIDPQILETIESISLSLGELYRKRCSIGGRGKIDTELPLEGLFPDGQREASLASIAAFCESVLMHHGLDDILIQEEVQYIGRRGGEILNDKPIGSVGDAIFHLYREKHEKNPDGPESMRDRYMRLDRGFSYDDPDFLAFVQKKNATITNDASSQLSEDIKAKQQSVASTIESIRKMVETYNKHVPDDQKIDFVDPSLGPHSIQSFRDQCATLRDRFARGGGQGSLFDSFDSSILETSNVEKVINDINAVNDATKQQRNALTYNPQDVRLRKEYLLAKAAEGRQTTISGDVMTDWINDLTEPYRTLVLQLFAHAKNNPTIPFSLDESQIQRLCTGLRDEQRKKIAAIEEMMPGVDYLTDQYKNMFKALYGQEGKTGISIDYYDPLTGESSDIHIPILGRRFVPRLGTPPLTPADVVSDNFFPYQVTLDISQLPDVVKADLDQAGFRGSNGNNLVLTGKDELDRFVKVMRELPGMTKSKHDRRIADASNDAGINENPENQNLEKLSAARKELVGKHGIDTKDSTEQFPGLKPGVSFVSKLPDSAGGSGHPLSADAWMSFEVQSVSTDMPPMVTVIHRGGSAGFKPQMMKFPLTTKFISYHAGDSAFFLKDDTTLPSFEDVAYTENVVKPTLGNGGCFVVPGDAYPLPGAVGPSHQNFFFSIEKSGNDYIIKTDPWYEFEEETTKKGKKIKKIIEQHGYPSIRMSRSELLGFFKEREKIGLQRVEKATYDTMKQQEKDYVSNAALYNDSAGDDMKIPITIAGISKFFKDAWNGIIDGFKKKGEAEATRCANHFLSKLSALSGVPIVGGYLGDIADGAHKALQEEKVKEVKDFLEYLNGYQVDGHPSRVVGGPIKEVLEKIKGPVCNLDHKTRCQVMACMMYMYTKESNPYARGLKELTPGTYVRGILGEALYRDFLREYAVLERRVRAGDDQALEAFASLERDFIVENLRGGSTYFKSYNSPNDGFIKHFPRSIINEFAQVTDDNNLSKKYDDQEKGLAKAPYSACKKDFFDNVKNGHYPQAFASLFMMYKKATSPAQRKEVHGGFFLLIVSGAALWGLDDPLQSKMQEIARSIGFPIAIMSQRPDQESLALTLLRLSQTIGKDGSAITGNGWEQLNKMAKIAGDSKGGKRTRPGLLDGLLTSKRDFGQKNEQGNPILEDFLTAYTRMSPSFETFLGSTGEPSLVGVVSGKYTDVNPVDKQACEIFFKKVVNEDGSTTRSLPLENMTGEDLGIDPFLLGPSVFNFLAREPDGEKQKKRYYALWTSVKNKMETIASANGGKETDSDKFVYVLKKMLGILGFALPNGAEVFANILENYVIMKKQNASEADIKRMVAILLWTRFNAQEDRAGDQFATMKNFIKYVCVNLDYFDTDVKGRKITKALDDTYEKGSIITDTFMDTMKKSSEEFKKVYIPYGSRPGQREYEGLFRSSSFGYLANNEDDRSRNEQLVYDLRKEGKTSINQELIDAIKSMDRSRRTDTGFVNEDKIDSIFGSITGFVPPKVK